VITIGAGMAGLAAAESLAAAGLRVLVLEGRDRTGGRVDTRHERDWPVPLEAGAEFMHGLPASLERLRRQVGVRRREVIRRFGASDGRVLRSADREWRAALKLLEALPQQGPDRSYARLSRERWWRARASEEVQWLARSFVEGFNAAPADRISVLSLARETASSGTDETRLFHLEGGYGRLVDALEARGRRAGVTVRLGTVVHRIGWRRGQVQVAARGVFGQPLPLERARAAVITLPVGILRDRSVRFVPALPPDKRRALRGVEPGPVLRILLRFRRLPAALVRRRFTFLHVRGASFPAFWRAAPEGDAPVLVAWAAGPAAARLEALDDQARLRAALASLARGLLCSRNDLANTLEAWRLHDWQRDPFSRGAYSYVVPGATAAQERLAAPVEDTLFFAGEATHTGGAIGTVHGALETGTRAAGELLSRR
jgi:monoamine oxidase